MKTDRRVKYDHDLIRSMYASGDTREVIAVRLKIPLNSLKKILANGGKGTRPGTGKKKKTPDELPTSGFLPWDAQPSLNAVALLAKNGILEGAALSWCVRKIQQMIREKAVSNVRKEVQG